MATMYPAIVPDDKPTSEKLVFEKLKTLNNNCHVFYSVLWQSKRNWKEGDGEADFIVFDPNRGLIVIEVKGGGISIVNGNWKTTNNVGTHDIKNPFDQAKDSKHALIKFLDDAGLGHIPICHGVVFPNESDNKAIGTYGHRDIIWYRNDIADIRIAVKRTYDHWGHKCLRPIDNLDISRLKDLLAPTFIIRKKLVDSIIDVNDTLLILTNNQITAFRQIRKNRKAIITGGAGTGITPANKHMNFESVGVAYCHDYRVCK